MFIAESFNIIDVFIAESFNIIDVFIAENFNIARFKEVEPGKFTIHEEDGTVRVYLNVNIQNTLETQKQTLYFKYIL